MRERRFKADLSAKLIQVTSCMAQDSSYLERKGGRKAVPACHTDQMQGNILAQEIKPEGFGSENEGASEKAFTGFISAMAAWRHSCGSPGHRQTPCPKELKSISSPTVHSKGCRCIELMFNSENFSG